MPEANIQLNGKTAIVAVVLVITFFIYKIFLASNALPPDAEAVVRETVKQEYIREIMKRTDISQEVMADQILSLKEVPFISIQGKGQKFEKIVRYEIQPNDLHPSDMDYVGYMNLTRTLGSAWREEGFATATSYNMKLF